MAGPWSPEQRRKHAATVARKRAETPPTPRGFGIRCDLCGISAAETKVLRFVLTRHMLIEGRETTRGFGSLDLCERCWSETAGRRRRRQKHRDRATSTRRPSNARSVRETGSGEGLSMAASGRS